MTTEYLGWAFAAVFLVAWLFAEHAAQFWKEESEEWQFHAESWEKSARAHWEDGDQLIPVKIRNKEKENG